MKIQTLAKWSEEIWNKYYFMTHSCYIEKAKHIHQLFFLILFLSITM